MWANVEKKHLMNASVWFVSQCAINRGLETWVENGVGWSVTESILGVQDIPMVWLIERFKR